MTLVVAGSIYVASLIAFHYYAIALWLRVKRAGRSNPELAELDLFPWLRTLPDGYGKKIFRSMVMLQISFYGSGFAFFVGMFNI